MSVFLPAAFLPGLTGRMYAQFALVIAATALISAINALTLKPTQSRVMAAPARAAREAQPFSRGFNRVYNRGRARLCRPDPPHGDAQRADGVIGLAIIAVALGDGPRPDRLSADRGPRLSDRGRAAAGRRRAGPHQAALHQVTGSPAKTRASIKSSSIAGVSASTTAPHCPTPASPM